MLTEALKSKRCLMVCGGGGVGKTTIAASIAISAAKVRERVLVVTIDPAKRLLQAFGFTDALLNEGGEPLKLSRDVLLALGLSESAQLSVAILNPKYVLDQIVGQSLSASQSATLKNTVIYKEMGQMIHGLQEYTAYEWVTRMIANNEYDLIVLDTPPAFHAKEFFNAPEKIKNLMESRVFQLFLPSKGSWFSSMLSFSWVEKLLGEKVYRESRLFFETFVSLRDRIISRCNQLSEFFRMQEVSVVTVGTTESTPLLELEGLIRFLGEKRIPLEAIIINQVEEASDFALSAEAETLLSPDLIDKLLKLKSHQDARADRALESFSHIGRTYSGQEIIKVPMVYSQDGFEILRKNSITLA